MLTGSVADAVTRLSRTPDREPVFSLGMYRLPPLGGGVC